jgi:hypothetical protein
VLQVSSEERPGQPPQLRSAAPKQKWPVWPPGGLALETLASLWPFRCFPSLMEIVSSGNTQESENRNMTGRTHVAADTAEHRARWSCSHGVNLAKGAPGKRAQHMSYRGKAVSRATEGQWLVP